MGAVSQPPDRRKKGTRRVGAPDQRLLLALGSPGSGLAAELSSVSGHQALTCWAGPSRGCGAVPEGTRDLGDSAGQTGHAGVVAGTGALTSLLFS